MTHPLSESEHNDLVQALARQLQVQTKTSTCVIQTHISSVILCGEFAYKLKRPVKFAFIDFSSQDKRRHDCETEFRINQRTAPMLYLSVEPITGSVESPEINGNGPVIDWVLRMRRFPQENLLSERLRCGKITTTEIDGLADHLADYQSALPILTEHDLSSIQPAADWIEEALDCIAEGAAVQLAGEVTIVRDFARTESNRLMPLLQTRRAQGHYRECHGDLHLENIVEINGQFVAFDALEFDQALRTIDRINDLAFPFMDLLAHQRTDLAWRLINGVLAHTGDYESLVLLRYYALYRACVRAKVARLSGNQAKFEPYWTLALALAKPPTQARLILVAGLSGSGKSTAAEMIVEAIGGARLRADVERKRLFPAAADDTATLYGAAATDATYARLLTLTQTLLGAHVNVVIDATFLDQSQVNRFAPLMKSTDSDTAVIVCQASPMRMRDRIRERRAEGKDPSDATETILTQQIERSKRPIHWPRKPIVVQNDGTLAQLQAAVTVALAGCKH